MSIQKVESSSYTAASCNSLEYDVFLSFRGEDTRKNFTGHLYNALNQEGIKVFKDDKELERGKVISPELIKAIEKSRFSLIVLSRNYASSTWCLEELVKIIECKNIRGQMVIPIFYDVDPSTVRKQSGSFKEAFIKHEDIENIERVQKWKSALKEVANLSGWDANDWDESELIQVIVKEIIGKLSPSKRKNNKDLVGIKSRLEELMMLIDVGSNNTQMIGIWGTGGVGKTTIARVIYELICDEFEGSSFLANVRENSNNHGIVSLQKQLLFQILKRKNFNICDEYEGSSMIKDRLQCKKVLIVLDDVDRELLLDKLAQHDWVGSGSRIIITTRERRWLKNHGVDKIYTMKGLNDDDSVQLFSLNAFKSHQPSKEYEKHSMQVVKYSSGIPLALKVLGSFFFNRSAIEWEESIKIFLDLACFFKGYDKDCVIKILNDDFCPTIGINDLVDKSLITISNENRIEMHDLLQAMGQQIAKKDPNHSGKRLWEKEDSCHALKNNQGLKKVEGMMIKEDLNISVSAKAFSKMINLRLLKVKNVQLVGELEYLSEKLGVLEWDGFPDISWPSSSQQLPKWIQPLKLTKLSFVDCPNLEEVPDLTSASNLDVLIFDGCPSLREIHSPHLILKKLSYLEVIDCANLTTLPRKISMDSLEESLIDGCPKLEKFPDIMEKMERLSHLFINGTAIKDMPSSIELLTGLEELHLSNNRNLVTLPDSINGLKSLQTFELSGSSSLQSLPTTMNGLKSLRSFLLYRCSSLQNLSTTMNGLTSLRDFEISGCFSLQNLSITMNGLTSLETFVIAGCSSLQNLSTTMNGLTSLHTFKLFGCSSLQSLPVTINGLTSLYFLDLSDCSSLQSLPNTINGLKSLRELDLSGCSHLESLPSAINGLTSLVTFKLSGCSSLQSLPTTINGLTSLVTFKLSGCSSLQSLPTTINSLKSLWFLSLSGCSSLESLPTTINGLKSLEILDLSGCSSLQSLPTTINGLKSLTEVNLSGCSKLNNVAETLVQAESLVKLCHGGTAITRQMSSIFLMKNLRDVSFKGCKEQPSESSFFRQLLSLQDLCYLERLDLSDCDLREEAIPDDFFYSLVSLEVLDLSRNDFVSLPESINCLPRLTNLYLNECKRLQSVPELPSSMSWVNVNDCASLETISDAFKANNSRSLVIYCQNCWKLFSGDSGSGSLMFTVLKDILC